MTRKILCVDDEPRVLDGYQRQFRKYFDIDVAPGGEAGLKLLTEQGPYAAVISDMRMPAMNGAEFLTRVRALAADTVRIMLTGYADLETAIKAVNQGRIFRFLTKPCSPEEFIATVEAGIEQYRLLSAERQLLEETLNGSVTLLTDMLAMVDPESFEHAVTLRDEAADIAGVLGVESIWDIELAAMLAHIAYVTLPPGVLGRFQGGAVLTGEEQALIDHVPDIGARLLKSIPRLEPVAEAIRYQAKNFDGSGWPNDAVTGGNIPLGGRILRVVSDLQRLMSGGVERKTALKQMKQRVGHYDPKVLNAAIAVSSDLNVRQRKPIIIDMYVHHLRPGFQLVSPMETEDGTLLLAAGKKITRAMLERLNNYARFTRIREPIRVDISRQNASAGES